MATLIKGNPWVWVVVMDPGKNEQFLGQHYKKEDISFIPTFHMKRDKRKKYEVQAIEYNELARDASKHNFMLFILNGAGEILEKIKP